MINLHNSSNLLLTAGNTAWQDWDLAKLHFYDERIETTGLTDKGLTESVQKLQKQGRHGDLVRKWFIYTKNKVKRLGFESNQYIIANYNVDKLEGEVHPNGLAQENIWLSFAEGPVVF